MIFHLNAKLYCSCCLTNLPLFEKSFTLVQFKNKCSKLFLCLLHLEHPPLFIFLILNKKEFGTKIVLLISLTAQCKILMQATLSQS